MNRLSTEDKRNLEAIFSNLKNGMKREEDSKELEKYLKQIYKKNIKVSIISTKERNYAFVMAVIPETSTIDKITKGIAREAGKIEIISEIWKKCNNWLLEIDERILDNTFSDAELVGLLLHEVGHVIDTNSVPRKLTEVVQFGVVNASFNSKSLLKKNMFNKLLSIPVISACIYGNTKDALKEEMKADQFAVKNGYLTQLVSAMNKIESRGFGKKTISSSMQFTDAELKALSERKAKLVKEKFEDIESKLPNCYLKESVTEAKDLIFKNFEKKCYYTDTVYEKVSDEVDSIISDSYVTEFLGIGKQKLKQINQNEIDYVLTKMQDIQSIDDKLMLVSYINSKIDMIHYYLDIMADPNIAKKYIIPNTESQLVRFNNQLVHAKKYILNYKIPEKNRELINWYPAGYEG